MKQVDARGCACPEPVMMTRAALQTDADGVQVLVDNSCAVENISRFAGNMGYTVTTEALGEETKVSLVKK